MRFRDRPLLVDGLDAGLYLDRPELERRIVEPLAGGRNVLLLGEAGSGKSTLLRRAAGLLAGRDRRAVMVNAGVADDPTGLLGLVAGALEEIPGAGGPTDPVDPQPGPEGLVRAVRRLRRDQPVTILLDGLIDPDVGYDVFGRLRDELWALGHSWAVAARPRDSAAVRTPPADAFWSTVVEIPPLDGPQIRRLLELGLTQDELEAIGGNGAVAAAHPRYVIRAAQEALDRKGDPHLPAAAPQPSEPPASGSEAIAVAALQGLGRPVSAQDPELLEALGWSRPYAQRILHRLEEAGVLRSIPDRSDRPGRPRKLYELNRHRPAA